MKCDLVAVFNHKYEKNIGIIESYYGGRFNNIWHLMPFAGYGKPGVIPVYDGSFTFQSFVAQAWKTLRESDADYFLFISDDLILDPTINQSNLEQVLALEGGGAFVPQLIDLSTGTYGRGVIEMKKLEKIVHHGLEIGSELPEREAAKNLISRHITLKSDVLRRYVPYQARVIHPVLSNLKGNWGHLKANIWHHREQLRHRLKPVKMSYPFVGGNSDIFAVPADRMEAFVHLCGIFSSMRVFVELAIPTALAMCCERLVTEQDTPRSGINYVSKWIESEVTRKRLLLRQIQQTTNSSLSNLAAQWPQEYMYLHPLKLSKWTP
ncbi:MAG: hypothetical protein ABI600_00420 [Luteolibacter sp.]